MHQACNENIDSKFLFGLSELTDSVTTEKKFLKQNGNLFQDGNLDFDNYAKEYCLTNVFICSYFFLSISLS